MKAIVLNCTLKPSPAASNTEALANTVISGLERQGVEVEVIRIVDHSIRPGVESDMGHGDGWPPIREKLLQAEILVLATPTWLGHMSSIAQSVLERMDGMISEKTDDGLPVAYSRVAGIVVTGNEDGAHHVIATVAQGLIDVGYTIPGQAWTYWNMGPGPGPATAKLITNTCGPRPPARPARRIWSPPRKPWQRHHCKSQLLRSPTGQLGPDTLAADVIIMLLDLSPPMDHWLEVGRVEKS